jgi:hypothetical protein
VTARRALAGVLLTGLLTGGCSGGRAAPAPQPSPVVPTAIPSYDGSLPPARAVLALVPIRATTVLVTDFAVIRRQVGLPELTGESDAGDRAAFWERAATASPLLSRGLLRPVDQRLRTSFGFGQDDVLWEAHFSGGGTRGWVLALRPGIDPARVRDAVRRGVGPLAGARVDLPDRLVALGTAQPGEPVWGSDPRWRTLLPTAGEAVVARRGCLDPSALPGPGAAVTRRLTTLQPLDGFTLTLGDHVATARMSRGRDDLFDRGRLAAAWRVGGGRFGSVFRHEVGDPSTGRIGFDVPHPDRAAALVRAGLLPFGVCGAAD